MKHGRDIYSPYQDVFWDGAGIERSEVCTLIEKEFYFCWYLESIRS